MATVKLVLRKSKKRANGEAPVYLRITQNRKTRFKSTGIFVKPNQWNETRQEVRRSHENYKPYNERLTDLRLKAERAALSAPSAKAVKTAVDGGGGNLIWFMKQFIEELDKRDAYWEWKKYRVTLGKIKECFGEEVNFRDIGGRQLIAFEQFLRKECENSTNTVRKEMGRLRRVYRKAIKEKIIAADRDPFVHYDMPQREKPDRRKVTIEEIGKLMTLDLPGPSWELAGRLHTVRDIFCFAFFGAGMRFGDVCLLRPRNVAGERLQYRMSKTGNHVDVPLPPPAQEIAEKYPINVAGYLFPMLSSHQEDDPAALRREISTRNAQANRALKDLAERVDIKPDGFSFHIARHGYADLARQRSGDLYAISKSLGHASLQVTQDYLKEFDRRATDKLAETMWGE